MLDVIKNELVEQVNFKGKLKRIIKTEDRLNLEVGDSYYFYREVESWGKVNSHFLVQNNNPFTYIFICDGLEGYEVDYSDYYICELLDCVDCDDEEEVLIKERFDLVISRILTLDEFTKIVMLEARK